MIELGQSVRGWTGLLRRLTGGRGIITPFLSETITPTLSIGTEVLAAYTEYPDFYFICTGWNIAGGGALGTAVLSNAADSPVMYRLKSFQFGYSQGTAADAREAEIDLISGDGGATGLHPGNPQGPVSNADPRFSVVCPGIFTGDSGSIGFQNYLYWNRGTPGPVEGCEDHILWPRNSYRIRIRNNGVGAVFFSYIWRFQILPLPDR